ncbi:MAG: hypothetical protein J6K22_00190 [Spirochaetaceae bacterium]|nr:hypothetical protein [Spirochaetaceae bacterium]
MNFLQINMSNSFIKGFLSFFLSFGKFLLLTLVCVALGFVVVWPLWFFAVNSPNLYSVIVIICLISLLVLFFVKKLVNNLKQKNKEEKKAYLFNLFRILLLLIILITGIIVSVFLILTQMRFIGIITFIVFCIIFGVCAIGIKKK